MLTKYEALELLNDYQEAQEALIWEYSGNIDAALDRLYKKCEELRHKIESDNSAE